MDKVATMPEQHRADLFRETGARTGLAPALIEKDFWVCWTLKHLFSIREFQERILFKGGTTLSKIFRAIRRFSEDIDLALDWEMLGFVGVRSPYARMSKTRRAKLLEEMLALCQQYIAGDFIQILKNRFTSVLGDPSDSRFWILGVDEKDPNIVNFQYPVVLESPSYVRSIVVLEIGTNAEFIPRDNYIVTPYAAEEFPELFDESFSHVTAIKAERTFWEKATILHQEYHRPKNKALPSGYSRHYYDVAMMGKSEIGSRALRDTDLLARVVAHKKRFYPREWARYDLAIPGSLRLMPSDLWVDALRRDYQEMGVMFFEDPPAFQALVEKLAVLEAEINGVASR